MNIKTISKKILPAGVKNATKSDTIKKAAMALPLLAGVGLFGCNKVDTFEKQDTQLQQQIQKLQQKQQQQEQQILKLREIQKQNQRDILRLEQLQDSPRLINPTYRDVEEEEEFKNNENDTIHA